jgi:DNA-binding NtrC family response regulator
LSLVFRSRSSQRFLLIHNVNVPVLWVAPQVLEDHPDVELLVTDINLPGSTNGLKLAAATKALRPDMNIIIVTGYSAPESNEMPPGSLFIAKPCDARKMIEAVRHFQWKAQFGR